MVFDNIPVCSMFGFDTFARLGENRQNKAEEGEVDF